MGPGSRSGGHEDWGGGGQAEGGEGRGYGLKWTENGIGKEAVAPGTLYPQKEDSTPAPTPAASPSYNYRHASLSKLENHIDLNLFSDKTLAT